jgi:hypothetical protein
MPSTTALPGLTPTFPVTAPPPVKEAVPEPAKTTNEEAVPRGTGVCCALASNDATTTAIIPWRRNEILIALIFVPLILCFAITLKIFVVQTFQASDTLSLTEFKNRLKSTQCGIL